MKTVTYAGHINSILVFKHSSNIITNPKKCHTLLEEVHDLHLKTKRDKLKSTNKKCLDPFKKTLNNHWDDPYIYENNTHYEE
jgi:hypothetical protein